MRTSDRNTESSPKTTRRQFLAFVSMLPVSAVLGKSLETSGAVAGATSTSAGPFSLPHLPYAYDALEPVIDAQTMRLHHDKHHGAYVDNLNKAIAKHPTLARRGLEELLSDLSAIPADVREAVRNHGGGHWNHTFFWELMTPGGSQQPTGSLAEALRSTFGSFEQFRSKFEEAGAKLFGSGWVWLVVTPGKKLEIVTTPNQDTPISQGATAILGNDVWEHAYYLKYQNRRAEYLAQWWKVVNWDVAGRHFARAMR